MLDGMKTCFENNIVHRDLKPENTFIEKGVFKIGDFGFC
jgi:serine/threonine protein kinase